MPAAMLQQPRVPPTGQRQAVEIQIKWREVLAQKQAMLKILSQTTGHSPEKLDKVGQQSPFMSHAGTRLGLSPKTRLWNHTVIGRCCMQHSLCSWLRLMLRSLHTAILSAHTLVQIPHCDLKVMSQDRCYILFVSPVL